LQGPKIRIGEISPAPINIENGEEVYFSVDIETSINAPQKIIPVQYGDFVNDVEVGETIYVDDGQLKFKVVGFDRGMAKCVALNEWVLKSNKGINLPDTNISLPPISEKDKKDILFGLEMKVDVISLSFVRSKGCMIHLRDFIDKNNSDMSYQPELMAKIERPEAIKNIDEILDNSDSMMIARGDLGIEIGLENLGETQDFLVNKAKDFGLPVYPATHFLKTMIDSPTPSRAEALDIYHAIRSGVDGILLSNETSVGKYPVECVEFLNRFE
jgi:pyruvate kinase